VEFFWWRGGSSSSAGQIDAAIIYRPKADFSTFKTVVVREGRATIEKEEVEAPTGAS